MTSAAIIDLHSGPDVQLDVLEILLQDRDWVDAEFAAIMNISGFGHRTTVAILTPWEPAVARRHGKRNRIACASSSESSKRKHAKVRSPPNAGG